MNRSQPKILSSLVIFMFLFTLFPAQADAQEQVTVEKAIGIVKTVFDVPESYSQFSSGIRDDSGMKRITLSWEEPGDQGGHFEAQVNAKNGDVVSMYQWGQEDSPASQLPTLTLDQAVSQAEKLLHKAAPSKAPHFHFQEDDQVVPLSGYGGTLYLRFLRYENDIPVENDTASVEINMTDGQIRSYNMEWSEYQLPSPQSAITPEKAAQVFNSEKMLELQYFLRQNQPRQTEPVLVYTLKHPSGGVIDAFTGEPVVIKGGPLRVYAEVATKDMAMGGMGSGSSPLTPEEISEIEKLAGLISQAEADKMVRELTGIPAAAELNSASLNPDYMDPELKIWRLNYQTKSENEPADYGASINAETGELLSYYAYDNYRRDKKPDMSREAAQKIAENWLQKIQAGKISQVRLASADEIKPGYEPEEWNFRYQRVVKAVLCPGNGINISVDRTTGNISYYNLSWNQASFPDVKGLGSEKAHEAFLQHMPMSLVYVTDYDSSQAVKFRLVYVPRPVAPAQSARMIDAVTGAKLDWEGKEMQDRIAVVYDDIEGHFAQEQIQLLAGSGIMTEYGSSFRPWENVNHFSR